MTDHHPHLDVSSRGRLSRWLKRRREPLRVVVFLGAVGIGLFLLQSVFASSDMPKATPTPEPTPTDARFEAFRGNCDSHGVKYKDPESSEEDRVKVFGPANAPENRAQVPFFGFEADLHKKAAACLQAVEADLKAQGTTYKVRELGSYREEREDRPWFFHQYGGAVDINPATNPICTDDLGGDYSEVQEPVRCDSDRPYDIPDEWVTTFERYGFYWGGNFRKGKDYMHFEWHGEAP